MKKVLGIIICFILFIPFCNAENNRLYFTEDGKKLVYDTDYFDEKIFMHHTDMYPGKEYVDVLDIENGTNNECELFFKILQEEQDEKAMELIRNINMKIYVDNELIYDGIATGEDILENNINLKNAISLGTFSQNKKSILKVYTALDSNYEDKTNIIESFTDWQFYAKCGEAESVEIINPDTGDTVSIKNFIVIILALLLLFCFIIMKKKYNS